MRLTSLKLWREIRVFTTTLVVGVLALMVVGVMPAAASGKIIARVDLSRQKMYVSVNGTPYATWRVSTGRTGYRTPTGSWRPKWLKRMHYSKKYNNSPMPYSIFFHGGYAVHGTNYVRRLGRPASHGCVRLKTSHARELYNLVKRYGSRNTRIKIIQ